MMTVIICGYPRTNRDRMVASLLGLDAYALREKTKWLSLSSAPNKEKKFFLGHSQMILLDFLFQDLSIVSRMSLRIIGAWSCPRKPVN